MTMRATDFEFRYRFFLIGACFWMPFFLYSFDKVNAGAALSQWIAHRTPLSSDTAVRLIFALGALLSITAAALRTWASAYLHSHIVHDTALHSENLVADGPYRHVRNPLYLGNVLLALGMGFMANREGYFLMVFGNLLIVYRLILREEAELLESQGESFCRFRKGVPRLFPSLTPRLAASGASPRWAQAFLGETFFWTFAGAAVVFALTFNLKYWYLAMALAMPLYAFSVIWLKRQNSATSVRTPD
jgi:protein-S-isoprenylcysteine O-methyltransferase Ste14